MLFCGRHKIMTQRTHEYFWFNNNNGKFAAH